MSQTIQYILIAAAVIVLLLIGLKLSKATFKTIFTIVLNAVIGALAIWLLNFIPAVEIPLVWWTALLAGIFGVPAVIIMLIVSLIK